jgi:hypothetical protein
LGQASSFFVRREVAVAAFVLGSGIEVVAGLTSVLALSLAIAFNSLCGAP